MYMTKLLNTLVCILMLTSAISALRCDKGFSFKTNYGIRHKSIKTEHWMRDSKSIIGPKKMATIAIPATHDSATYSIDPHNGLSADTATDFALVPQLMYVFQSYGLNVTNVKSFVAPWFKTQECDITGQLMHGIRHFDFRVCVQPGIVGPEKFYACHGLLADKYVDIYTQLSCFAASHPDEIVSLDFNHIYGFTSSALHVEFLNMTIAALGNPLQGTFNNTYNELVAMKTADSKFLMFYYSPQYSPIPGFMSSNNDIDTKWANKQNMPALKAAVMADLDARSNLSKPFVSQIEMTPDLNMMTDGIITGQNSVQVTAKNNYQVVSDWIEVDLNRGSINIVNTDYYTKDFISAVIDVNFD